MDLHFNPAVRAIGAYLVPTVAGANGGGSAADQLAAMSPTANMATTMPVS